MFRNLFTTLFLTRWTVMSSAAADGSANYFPFAAGTGFAFFTINIKMFLHFTLLTFNINKGILTRATIL